MLKLAKDDVKTIHANILTMLIITVFEIVLFYQFYSRKNEKSIRSAIDSSVARLTPMVPYREQDRTSYLYTSLYLGEKTKQLREVKKQNNHLVFTRVMVYVGLLSLFSAIIFVNSPYLREEKVSRLVFRAMVSVAFVLLTQFFLVTYVLERLKGNFEGKMIEMILYKLNSMNDHPVNVESVCDAKKKYDE